MKFWPSMRKSISRGPGRTGLEVDPVESALEPVTLNPSLPSLKAEKSEDIKSFIEFDHFNIWYSHRQVLNDISFGIESGKVASFVGPSGCGKSTLFRCLSLLTFLDEETVIKGNIYVGGAPLLGNHIKGFIRAHRRKIGIVFQKYNPFPCSIYENIAYALRLRGILIKNQLDEICERSLRMVGLWNEVKERLAEPASHLSGGQQQRLCIARAIAIEPEILILDEPWSELDPVASTFVDNIIISLAGKMTILFSTHDMSRAELSDCSIFMYEGRLIHYGSSVEIFRQPPFQIIEDFILGRDRNYKQ